MGFRKIFLILIFLMVMCGGAHATITGDSPNATGLTIIDQDTVWDDETLTLDSVRVGGSQYLNFTIRNCNIISTNWWSIGDPMPVNFVLDNSTITFQPTVVDVNTVYGVYGGEVPDAVNTSCKITSPKLYATTGQTTYNLKNSIIQGTEEISAGGIALDSGGSYGFSTNPSYAYSRKILLIDNLTIRYMGYTSPTWSMYYALSGAEFGKAGYTPDYQLSDQRAVALDDNSVCNGLHLEYCGVGVTPTPPLQIIDSTSYLGDSNFDGGTYFDNISMDHGHESFNPWPNATIKNSYFHANYSKLNLMSTYNTVFENNTVHCSAFNTGDGSIEGQGNNNTVRNCTFENSSAGSRKNYTYYINNTFSSGNPYGGGTPLVIKGNWQLADGNYIDVGHFSIPSGISIISYYSTPSFYYPQSGNNIIKNNVIKNTSVGIDIGGVYNRLAYNNTFINNSIYNSGNTAIKIHNATDQKFRDTYIKDSATYDVYLDGTNSNLTFINTYFSPSKIRVVGNDTYLPYYYLDVLTESGGVAVAGSAIALNKTAKNINVIDKSEFVAGSTGRTPLPTDLNNSGCILDYNQTSSGSANQTYSLTATADGYTPVTLDTIDPDSRWYRSIPDTSKYTIVVDFNESANTHITGYAPTTEFNNYKEGDSVKFQIWTSEAVDTISWKVNNTEVATNTLTYEAIVQEKPIIVDISGTDDNGAFSKSWAIEPTSNLPNANFSANATTGTYPMWVSFTDSSTDNPAYWHWDFDNDGITDSTSQNPTVKYKVKGNYTVTLTAGNANGELSKTETSYIHVTGATPSRIPFFSPFLDWLNSFYMQYIAGV